MRPKAILWFERLLLPALAIDLINNIVSLHPDPTNPFMAPRWFLFALFAMPSLIGLTFWYFIALRGSSLARGLFLALLCLGLVGLIVAFLDPGRRQTLWAVVLLSELLKTGAAACLFLPGTNTWFERGADRSSG